MKCKKCGADFEGNFCPYCGNPAKQPVKRRLMLFLNHLLKNDKKSGMLSEDNSSKTKRIFKQKKSKKQIKKPIYKMNKSVKNGQ